MRLRVWLVLLGLVVMIGCYAGVARHTSSSTLRPSSDFEVATAPVVEEPPAMMLPPPPSDPTPSAPPRPAARPSPPIPVPERGPASVKEPRVETLAPPTSRPVDVAIDAQLFTSQMVFTLPFVARVQQPIVAELVVDPSTTLAQLVEQVRDTQGHVVAEEIKTSRTITARLIAPGFVIEPNREIRQVVSLTEPTRWTWFLTSTQEGRHVVQLRVVAHLTIEGERVERELETFSRELVVEVTLPQRIRTFVSTYFQFLVVTLVLPVLGWLLRRTRPWWEKITKR